MTVARSWRERAACRGTDSDLFFPYTGQSGGAALQWTAADVWCGACTVRTECLMFAVETVQMHGLWGGLHDALERGKVYKRLARGHSVKGYNNAVEVDAATAEVRYRRLRNARSNTDRAEARRETAAGVQAVP